MCPQCSVPFTVLTWMEDTGSITISSPSVNHGEEVYGLSVSGMQVQLQGLNIIWDTEICFSFISCCICLPMPFFGTRCGSLDQAAPWQHLHQLESCHMSHHQSSMISAASCFFPVVIHANFHVEIWQDTQPR